MRPTAGAGPACRYADTTPLSACSLRSVVHAEVASAGNSSCSKSSLMAQVDALLGAEHDTHGDYSLC